MIKDRYPLLKFFFLTENIYEIYVFEKALFIPLKTAFSLYCDYYGRLVNIFQSLHKRD